MTRSVEIMNGYSFSAKTKRLVAQRKTEKGRLKILCSEEAFSEAFYNSNVVYEYVFNARRLKCNDKCRCGYSIKRYYSRIGNSKKEKCTKCGVIVSPLRDTFLEGMRKLDEIVQLFYSLIQIKHTISTSSHTNKSGKKYDTSLGWRHKLGAQMGVVLMNMKFEDKPVQSDSVYPKIPSLLPPDIPYQKQRSPNSEGVAKVQTLAQPGLVKPFLLEGLNEETLKPIFDHHVPVSTIIYSDEARCYNFLDNKKAVKKYSVFRVNHKQKEFSRNEGGNAININYTEAYNGALKNAIRAVFMGVAEHNLELYCYEIAYRFSFSFRGDPYLAIEALFDSLPPLTVSFEKRKRRRKNEAA